MLSENRKNCARMTEIIDIFQAGSTLAKFAKPPHVTSTYQSMMQVSLQSSHTLP